MWFLLARKCVKNTNVLLSSIFFIAASVVNGYLMMLNGSILQENEKNIVIAMCILKFQSKIAGAASKMNVDRF